MRTTNQMFKKRETKSVGAVCVCVCTHTCGADARELVPLVHARGAVLTAGGGASVADGVALTANHDAAFLLHGELLRRAWLPLPSSVEERQQNAANPNLVQATLVKRQFVGREEVT